MADTFTERESMKTLLTLPLYGGIIAAHALAFLVLARMIRCRLSHGRVKVRPSACWCRETCGEFQRGGLCETLQRKLEHDDFS